MPAGRLEQLGVIALGNAVERPSVVRIMNDRTETCRNKTRECERAALLATDADKRVIYFILACQWREMAKLAEEFDRN
jgi:hypothetical protein